MEDKEQNGNILLEGNQQEKKKYRTLIVEPIFVPFLLAQLAGAGTI